jgi:hypothetical protein
MNVNVNKKSKKEGNLRKVGIDTNSGFRLPAGANYILLHSFNTGSGVH